MRRGDLQALSEGKLRDAVLLLEHRRWSSAYYLAGYAVELGLKACIARQISADTIPDKAILQSVLSHDFTKLVGLAGLRVDLKEEQDRDPIFAANWAVALEWSPDARYRASLAIEAQLLSAALSEQAHGVHRWIRRYW